MNRFTPQEALVPHERMESLQVTIVGIGAIGRQVALQLTSIGVRHLQLIDFDTVDVTNVTTQGYQCAEIGELKAVALQRQLVQVDPKVQVEVVSDRYRPKYRTGEAVFCCVDSIAARAAIWNAVWEGVRFWADGRMQGEVVRVLALDGNDEEQCRAYRQTLFPQAEAHTGSCTSRSTVYAASIAAGLMVHQFCRWLRQITPDSSLMLNLLASELVVE